MRVGLSALIVLLLVGCGSGPAAPAEEAAPAATKPASSDGAAKTTAAAGAPTAAAKTAAKAAPVQIEACKLLTRDEVIAVAGPVGEPKEQAGVPQLFGCDFPDTTTPIVHAVAIRVFVYADKATAATEVQRTMQRNSYEEVPGLGERAYTTWPLPGVTALKGVYEVSVDVSPPDGGSKADNVQATRVLIEKALARLP